jgi:phosphatidylserine decarboxylase
MQKQLLDLVMPFLPKRTLSHWVGRCVHYRLPPPLARKSVAFFAKMYQIDLAEAELPLEQYPTIGALFTRRLKPGARPIGQGPVHPADALIIESGPIAQGTLLQCKGRTYALAELLCNAEVAADFEHGSFLTYYLCPTDYHRVHSPVEGTVMWSCHVPGEQWPVNAWGVKTVANLFCVNERVITLIQTPPGKVVVVMVAATNVGNITMSYDRTVCTTGRGTPRGVTARPYQPPKPLGKGEELGIFHMGSTVIVLFAPGVLPFDAGALRGCRVKMGESIRPPAVEI